MLQGILYSTPRSVAGRGKESRAEGSGVTPTEFERELAVVNCAHPNGYVYMKELVAGGGSDAPLE
ncbi:hypothetical protein [Bordetella genomosp. 12]|uniref:hypothetical protein n=1 Tax=Bordetella genomosp. 12 TaxID=463035 RepID=UPI0011786E55|nr:hypothetical protein [Bordetella genomosp. 12]